MVEGGRNSGQPASLQLHRSTYQLPAGREVQILGVSPRHFFTCDFILRSKKLFGCNEYNKITYEMAYQIFQQGGQFLRKSRKFDESGAKVWVVST